jgi:hypothetical protein
MIAVLRKSKRILDFPVPINRSCGMLDFIEILFSNKIYMMIGLCLLSVIVYFIIKKTIKYTIYAFILLIAFLAYISIFR